MKVLVLNCGSSSVKFQILEPGKGILIVKGLVEKVGSPSGIITYTPEGGRSIKQGAEVPDHKAAIDLIISFLTHTDYGVLKNVSEIDAIGHRVVHGGEKFTQAVKINSSVIAEIENCISLAPLHNPANLEGISACTALMGDIPQVAVFDTSFHQTMPKNAYIYALPMSMYRRYGIRRYGFHGTSHEFVAHKAAEILKKPLKSIKIITCHLGNGSSMCAVKGGESIDTTMGLTPLEGLVMGTRCGDIDPAIVPFIMKAEGLDASQVDEIMNKQSGLKGISGLSNDMREIEEAADKGDENASLAFELFCYRIRRYIGAYAAAMGGLDAVIFTAGIGENSPKVRRKCCEGLNFLGIKIDPKSNQSKETLISSGETRVLVIPTNEELAIARKAWDILTSGKEGLS